MPFITISSSDFNTPSPVVICHAVVRRRPLDQAASADYQEEEG
jgi:hypothetical protein